MNSIEDLVTGFRRFQRRYFHDDHSIYERLTHQGQASKVMIVMDCDPGDLFVFTTWPISCFRAKKGAVTTAHRPRSNSRCAACTSYTL